MNHGGARAGAGRKAIDPDKLRVQLGARVLPGVKNWLNEEAERQGVSVGRIIESIVEGYMA